MLSTVEHDVARPPVGVVLRVVPPQRLDLHRFTEPAQPAALYPNQAASPLTRDPPPHHREVEPDARPACVANVHHCFHDEEIGHSIRLRVRAAAHHIERPPVDVLRGYP